MLFPIVFLDFSCTWTSISYNKIGQKNNIFLKNGRIWLKYGHILNVFSKMADQFSLIPFAWCQASPGTGLEYPQVVLWCRLTMAIFRPFFGHIWPFWWQYCFLPNFDVWNWFLCTWRVQRYSRKKRRSCFSVCASFFHAFARLRPVRLCTFF